MVYYKFIVFAVLTFLLPSALQAQSGFNVYEDFKISKSDDASRKRVVSFDAVPIDLSPAELVQYAQTMILNYSVSRNLSKEQIIDEAVKQAKFLINTSNAALEMQPKDEVLKQVYALKYHGLKTLQKAEYLREHMGESEDSVDELARLLAYTNNAKNAADSRTRFDKLLSVKGNSAENNDTYLLLLASGPIDLSPAVARRMLTLVDERQKMNEGLLTAFGEELCDILRDPNAERLPDADKETERLTRCFIEKGLTGITIHGNKFDIKRFQGNYVLVDFFAPWCKPCVEEMLQTKRLYHKYNKKGFEVVAVGIGNNAAIRELAKRQNLPYTVVSDELTVLGGMSSVAAQYEVTQLPTAVLVSPKGKIIDRHARGQRLETSLRKAF